MQRRFPFLPLSLAVMSVPLYLGYFIKNLLLPGPVFLFVYPWLVVSFLAVPLLCLAEAAVLVRLRGAASQGEARRAHAGGLAIGLAAFASALLVRFYG